MECIFVARDMMMWPTKIRVCNDSYDCPWPTVRVNVTLR